MIPRSKRSRHGLLCYSPARSISSRLCHLPEHNRIRNNVKVDLVTISGTRIITSAQSDRRPEFRDRRVRLAIAQRHQQRGH